MSTDIFVLWYQLTPEHQTLLARLIQSLAVVDARDAPRPANGEPAQREPPTERTQDAVALLRAWRAEDQALSPEAKQAAQAEWETLKTALNADRLSDRPLFP